MTLISTGHDDRPVHLLESSGGRCITKRYPPAAGAEVWSNHLALWETSFGHRRSPAGIPEPMSFDPGTGTITMELIDGEPLACRGDLGRSVELARPVARLLADIHRSQLALDKRRSASSIVRSVHRKAFELGDASLGDAMFEVARRLNDHRDVVERLVPSHGDFSPRNLLASSEGLRLIDLDRLQLAGRGRDLAYWGAWTWATQLLAGDVPSWEIGDAFITEYALVCPGVLRELEATLPFHRSAALCRIAHGWSALQRRPDLARLVIDEARAVIESP
jgi:tRNA A-37 threonylcarbamoyl transferase component Bud32